jgi:hypothetical protein
VEEGAGGVWGIAHRSLRRSIISSDRRPQTRRKLPFRPSQRKPNRMNVVGEKISAPTCEVQATVAPQSASFPLTASEVGEDGGVVGFSCANLTLNRASPRCASNLRFKSFFLTQNRNRREGFLGIYPPNRHFNGINHLSTVSFHPFRSFTSLFPFLGDIIPRITLNVRSNTVLCTRWNYTCTSRWHWTGYHA